MRKFRGNRSERTKEKERKISEGEILTLFPGDLFPMSRRHNTSGVGGAVKSVPWSRQVMQLATARGATCHRTPKTPVALRVPLIVTNDRDICARTFTRLHSSPSPPFDILLFFKHTDAKRLLLLLFFIILYFFLTFI